MSTSVDERGIIFYGANSSGVYRPYNNSTYASADLSYLILPSFNEPEPIDEEASLCIIDDNYFEIVLFNVLRDLFHIDINYDKSKLKELKISLRKTLNEIFKTFINREIIENFNIIGIYPEGDYLKVRFNVVKKNKIFNLSKVYEYKSKNYGFK